MTRAMRRSKQGLSEEACLKILEAGTSGVLALLGDEGYPYALPLSYAYADGKIYFHGASTGHKIDAMAQEPRASFCVVSQDQVVPLEYTTRYASVIAFGRAAVVKDPEELQKGLEALAFKYAPQDTEAHRTETLTKPWPSLCIFALTVERMTGKASMQLIEKGL
ncbi:MAG: pyridoxamine 5'-phosphate oxidase family protein [Eubacterium sp.]|nr:pyridoxamine 5'-phosphate oxidase family protein [Eubacterium sp.]